MKTLSCISVMVVAVLLNGCASIERINQNMKSSEATGVQAKQQMQKLTTSSSVLREASRQWVNPIPIIDRAAIKKSQPRLVPSRLTGKAH